MGGALIVGLLTTATALAANSFSDSMRTFGGNSTTTAIQAELAAAGFNFSSTAGLDAGFTNDPTIVFDSNGATFGSHFSGDGGRNYIRTNDSDYATVNFVAEVTFQRNNGVDQQIFIGMGGGELALWGVPDWSTLLSSTYVSPENQLTTFRTANDANESMSGPTIPNIGSHRVRMTFDSVTKAMTYAIDVHYAGGAFVADATAPTTNLVHIDCPVGCGSPERNISADFFAADGWPGEPSRIYFGGDDGSHFRDFSVTVSVPVLSGDYNSNNSVDAADYVLWRNTLGQSDLGNGLVADGDFNGIIDSLDYAVWRANFGKTLAGSSTTISKEPVPEPAVLALSACGLMVLAGARRRKPIAALC